MSSTFIQAVFDSSATDGWDFMNKYELHYDGAYYGIIEKSTKTKLGNFKSKNKAVIDALMTDSAQNYGR